MNKKYSQKNDWSSKLMTIEQASVNGYSFRGVLLVPFTWKIVSIHNDCSKLYRD